MALCTSMIGGTGKHSQNLLDTVIYFFLQEGPLLAHSTGVQSKGWKMALVTKTHKYESVHTHWNVCTNDTLLAQRSDSTNISDLVRTSSQTTARKSHKNEELTLRVSAVWYGAGQCDVSRRFGWSVMFLGGPIFPPAFQVLVVRLEIPCHGDQKKRGRSCKQTCGCILWYSPAPHSPCTLLLWGDSSLNGS